MRPEDPIATLYSRQLFGIKPGLERIRKLLEALGAPQEAFRAVLIGGTNGKGSAARVLHSCLGRDRAPVGLYTSPHLSRLGERLRVGEEEASADELRSVVERVLTTPAAEEATFFELLTAAACLHFAEAGVRWAVMEVGLGGSFDATNALEPVTSVITGVALDHTEVLGKDLRGIARDKAGILRPRSPALTGAVGEALTEIEDRARRIGAELWRVGREIELAGSDRGWEGIRLDLSCPSGEVSMSSPLVGLHQVRNVGLAAAAALRLGVPREAVADGVARARWPGRLERLPWGDRWVVFDGAHNPEAAAALARSLNELGEGGATLVVGVAREKDLAGMASSLAPVVGDVIATRARYSPRALAATAVASVFDEVRAFSSGEGGGGHGAGRGETVVEEDPVRALERATAAAGPGGTVVVAGSLHLVGELRPLVAGGAAERHERWQ